MLKLAHVAIAAAILYVLAMLFGEVQAKAETVCVDHFSGLRMMRETGFHPSVIAYMSVGQGDARKVEIWSGKAGKWMLFYWANELMICPILTGDRWTGQGDAPGMVSRP